MLRFPVLIILAVESDCHLPTLSLRSKYFRTAAGTRDPFGTAQITRSTARRTSPPLQRPGEGSRSGSTPSLRRYARRREAR